MALKKKQFQKFLIEKIYIFLHFIMAPFIARDDYYRTLVQMATPLDDCLIVNIASKRGGYGVRSYNGKLYELQRLVYWCSTNLLSPDDLPKRDEHFARLDVCHLCPNKQCIKKEHYTMATSKDNHAHKKLNSEQLAKLIHIRTMELNSNAGIDKWLKQKKYNPHIATLHDAVQEITVQMEVTDNVNDIKQRSLRNVDTVTDNVHKKLYQIKCPKCKQVGQWCSKGKTKGRQQWKCNAIILEGEGKVICNRTMTNSVMLQTHRSNNCVNETKSKRKVKYYRLVHDFI